VTAGESTKRTSVEFPRSASIRDLFLHYVDLTSIPKKVFIRMLAEHAEGQDKAILMFLSRFVAALR
jgi:hypothetical protein